MRTRAAKARAVVDAGEADYRVQRAKGTVFF
jgi:hypothetical protein